MTDTERNQIKKLGIFIHDKGVSNEFLVEIIKLCGDYLNIETPMAHSKRINKSIQWVYKGIPSVVLFGNKFTIENK